MSRALALGLTLLAAVACGGGNRNAGAPSPETPSAPPASPPPAAEAAPLAKSTVTLYFPSATDDRLVAESRAIIETPRPADRGAQILAALLDGPEGEGALPFAPDGTTLRRLWVRDDGTAYADFSSGLADGLAGSSEEILRLYAIVDSLTTNVPEIKRVGILIDGRERETLGGHVDVRRPIGPDASLVATAGKKE
ncbi:MAG TPA: GerMN domain-containing protein [Candidatus Polarisedimenticolaceae bacterium]|nr:GerMN domain-containing protein [Candidatus Polarisedimenticolaceae bacterium]